MLRIVRHLSCEPGTITHNLTDGGAAAMKIVIPSIAGLFFTSLTHKVSSVTAVCGCGVVLTGSSRGSRGRVRILGALLTGRISNVVCVNGGVASRLHTRFSQSGAPIILTKAVSPRRRIKDIGVSCVNTARRNMTGVVTGKGGRVTFMSTSLSGPVGKRCQLGNCGGTLIGTGVPFSRTLIFRYRPALRGNRLLTPRLLRTKISTTCMTNSRLTVNLLGNVVGTNIDIPRTFRIATDGGSHVARVTHPGLASVVLPLCSVNTMTVHLLAGVVGGRRVSRGSVVLPCGVIGEKAALPGGWYIRPQSARSRGTLCPR